MEDDDVNAALLRHALENSPKLSALQLRVDTCTTAEMMIDLFEQGGWNFCIVIVDEYLTDAGGKMTGSEGIIELKKRGCLSKFISCSGNCTPTDCARFTAAGADAVWPKPLHCAPFQPSP